MIKSGRMGVLHRWFLKSMFHVIFPKDMTLRLCVCDRVCEFVFMRERQRQREKRERDRNRDRERQQRQRDKERQRQSSSERESQREMELVSSRVCVYLLACHGCLWTHCYSSSIFLCIFLLLSPKLSESGPEMTQKPCANGQESGLTGWLLQHVGQSSVSPDLQLEC